MTDKKIIKIVSNCLEEMKAQNTVIIDISKKSSIADFMIVSSGTSSRHVSSIADKIQRTLKNNSYKDIQIEGLPSSDWVLIDAIDAIINIFKPGVREFYMIEKIWSENLIINEETKIG
ncbi:MAG: ribosome silencing factor [Hyphomicrobiales bacterium]|jgi:ribosome-associated protein|nr:ribosome silencing factor [Hyphomicrobiales bacterium]|tara:strand:+ start:1978 stop:2331 length:354 start_codon:yes stop_codon:yes gene_type:complete